MCFSFNLYIQFNLQARYPSSHSKLTNSLRQATYNLITEIDAGRVTVDMSQYTGVSSRFNVKTVHFDEVCKRTRCENGLSNCQKMAGHIIWPILYDSCSIFLVDRFQYRIQNENSDRWSLRWILCCGNILYNACRNLLWCDSFFIIIPSSDSWQISSTTCDSFYTLFWQSNDFIFQ